VTLNTDKKRHMYFREIGTTARTLDGIIGEEVERMVNGRLDRRRLWELNTERAMLAKLRGEKWFKRVCRLRKMLPGEADAGVYILINNRSRHCYVGETENFSRRWREHLYGCKRFQKGKMGLSMRSEGLHNWIMIPLEGVKDRKDRRMKERHWAHTFRTHLINDVGAWRNQNQVTRESKAGKRKRPTRNLERFHLMIEKKKLIRGGNIRLLVKLLKGANDAESREEWAVAATQCRMPDGLREKLEMSLLRQWLGTDVGNIRTISGTVGRTGTREILAKWAPEMKYPMTFEMWVRHIRIRQVPLRRLREVTDGGRLAWDEAFTGMETKCSCVGKHTCLQPWEAHRMTEGISTSNTKTAIMMGDRTRMNTQARWMREDMKKVMIDCCGKTGINNCGIAKALSELQEIPSHIVDEKALSKVVRNLGEAIMVEVDKNPNGRCVVCPKWLREKTEEAYSCEAGTYSTVKGDEKDILEGMQQRYKDVGLEMLAKWKVEGELAWGRAIPKHKDIERMRPIVSSCKTGYHRAGKIAARCLTVLVKEVKKKTVSADMGSVEELPAIVRRLNGDKGWRAAFGSGGVMMMKFDIKEQYTSLSQEELRTTIDWAFNKVGTKVGKGFSIARRREDRHLDAMKTRHGRLFREVGSDLVRAYIEFELDNAYFRVGNRNIHQRVGVPMGAMASAAMAVLDSIRREHEQRRMWESKEVAIHRFRDDIWVLTQGEARRIGEHVWLEKLQQMYGNDLRVVLEEKSDSCVQFVGCQLRVEGDRLVSYVVNPNIRIDESGRITAQDRRVRWPETFNACGPHVIQGTMVGAIKRCMTMCTEVWSENRCILEHCLEWMRKGYDMRKIRHAVMRARPTEARWIRQIVGMLREGWCHDTTQKSWIQPLLRSHGGKMKAVENDGL